MEGHGDKPVKDPKGQKPMTAYFHRLPEAVNAGRPAYLTQEMVDEVKSRPPPTSAPVVRGPGRPIKPFHKLARLFHILLDQLALDISDGVLPRFIFQSDEFGQHYFPQAK